MHKVKEETQRNFYLTILSSILEENVLVFQFVMTFEKLL